MNSRWYNTAVVVLWLATMSWLVTEKVLPPLLVGEPPSYRQIIEAQNRDPPVGWQVLWKGQPLGWALTDTKLQPNGLTTEIHGRVHFDALPLGADDARLAPALLGAHREARRAIADGRQRASC